jgi:hypothetical protein
MFGREPRFRTTNDIEAQQSFEHQKPQSDMKRLLTTIAVLAAVVLSRWERWWHWRREDTWGVDLSDAGPTT